MNRVLPFILCLILLCGCADDGKGQFAEFVKIVSTAENISFSAHVAAQYDEKTAEFTLAYEQTKDGASISVVEPELLSGIKANLSGESLSLEYDGAMLDILNATVNYLNSKHADIDKRTLACRDWLEKTIRKGE